MTEGKRPVSEVYATRNHLRSAGEEMEDDYEHPIISLSKSFTDMASGPPQRMELAWCWKDIRKSASSAVCPQRPASMGGPVRDVQAPSEFEQGSTYSGNSTPETVIWYGGTTRPWSITEDSPARRTPTQEHFLGREQAYTSESTFPMISLTRGPGSDICPAAEDTGPKTPIKEVEWDAEGMTWEVYGASLDPEELGLAIQRHLELQIKETAAAATENKTSGENNCMSNQPSKKRKGGSVMQSLRSPACCSRSSAVED